MGQSQWRAGRHAHARGPDAGFFRGWTFPRHLYTSDVYRVWGNIPYDLGDYLTDNLIDLIYPGYVDASYYHDERGFISPTPTAISRIVYCRTRRRGCSTSIP